MHNLSEQSREFHRARVRDGKFISRVTAGSHFIARNLPENQMEMVFFVAFFFSPYANDTRVNV